jgi:cytochrome P450
LEHLHPDELVAQMILHYVAGHETTLNLVGNGLTHLFEFPGQLDRLRTDPALDTNGIEELLRFDSPVQFARRIAVEPFEVDEVAIPAGAVVLLGLGVANRDPAKWGSTADAVDLARPGSERARLVRRRSPLLPRCVPGPPGGAGFAAPPGPPIPPHGAGLRRAGLGEPG